MTKQKIKTKIQKTPNLNLLQVIINILVMLCFLVLMIILLRMEKQTRAVNEQSTLQEPEGKTRYQELKPPDSKPSELTPELIDTIISRIELQLVDKIKQDVIKGNTGKLDDKDKPSELTPELIDNIISRIELSIVEKIKQGVLKGEKGDQGPRGPQGPEGPQGKPGPMGPQGSSEGSRYEDESQIEVQAQQETTIEIK